MGRVERWNVDMAMAVCALRSWTMSALNRSHARDEVELRAVPAMYGSRGVLDPK